MAMPSRRGLRLIVFACTAVLAVSRPAAAEQEISDSVRREAERSTARPAALVPLYISMGVLQGLDSHSTLLATRRGGNELNPLVRSLTEEPIAFIAVKALGTAGAILLAERLWKEHRVAAVVMLVALNGAYTAIVTNNYARAR